MRKIILSLRQVVFIMATVLFCFQCYAQTIPSSELIKDAKQYDGKNMTYQGEVVGDIMIRGLYAWLNVNDGSNAIGIWIRKDFIKGIQYIGSYQAKGDIVEVSGIFNHACPEHGGDLDIHAESVRTLRSGVSIEHAVNNKEIKVALGLSCMMILVWLLYSRTKKQQSD